VTAFDRVKPDAPVMRRAEVTEPDVVVVLDPGLLAISNVTAGLKEGGTVVINTKKTAAQIRSEYGIRGKLALIDATRIARELLGVPIVNTTMLGAVIAATGIINLDSVVAPLQKRFGRLAERNLNAMKKASAETRVEE